MFASHLSLSWSYVDFRSQLSYWQLSEGAGNINRRVVACVQIGTKTPFLVDSGKLHARHSFSGPFSISWDLLSVKDLGVFAARRYVAFEGRRAVLVYNPETFSVSQRALLWATCNQTFRVSPWRFVAIFFKWCISRTRECTSVVAFRAGASYSRTGQDCRFPRIEYNK